MLGRRFNPRIPESGPTLYRFFDAYDSVNVATAVMSTPSRLTRGEARRIHQGQPPPGPLAAVRQAIADVRQRYEGFEGDFVHARRRVIHYEFWIGS